MGLSLSKLGTQGFEKYGVKFTAFEYRRDGLYGKVEGTERWQYIYPSELLRYKELLMKVVWESRLEQVVTGNKGKEEMVERHLELLKLVEQVCEKRK